MFEASKRRKLEKERQGTLSIIRNERHLLDAMVQRARALGNPSDPEQLIAEPLSRLDTLTQQATNCTDIDKLEDMDDEAVEWGTFKAYICPSTEVETEGNLSLNLMEEWGVPKNRVEWMKTTLDSKLNAPDTKAARSALKMILMEENSWLDYTNEYESTMKRYTWQLSLATMLLIVCAVVGLRYRLHAPPLIFIGILLFSGAAGSCVSVMMKLPMLDVALSSELDAYGRRVLSRVVIGTIASIVGCALFAVLTISIDKLNFADVMSVCTSLDVALCGQCSIVKQIILIALPLLLGFSERTLISVERKVLGES
jgi:hypothetical protein